MAKHYSVTELHCVTAACNTVTFHTTMQLEHYVDIRLSVNSTSVCNLGS